MTLERQHSLWSNMHRLSVAREEQESDNNLDLKETTISESPSSHLSILSAKKEKRSLSSTRFYRYIELEEALMSAGVLERYVDRIRFHQEYLQSIRENRFDEYLKKSYEQLEERKKKIEEEKHQKHLRTFTFVDLEERFLANDPTQDIKIVFVDDPTGLKAIQSTTLMYKDYQMKTKDHDYSIDIESFYKDESDRFFYDSPRVRDEVTLFARQAGENLNQYLPHLPRVPHRVTIVDQRDQILSSESFDEKQLQLKQHEENLFLISQRRQMISKMIEQSKKNQLRMKESSLMLRKKDNFIRQSSSSKDLLEYLKKK